MCFYTCKRYIGLLNIIFHSFQKEHSYYTIKVYRWIIFRPSIQVSCLINRLKRAGSLNQGAATASSEPILEAAHLIAIFKRKMAVVSRKHLRNTRGSLAAVNDYCFRSGGCFPSDPTHHCHFSFKDLHLVSRFQNWLTRGRGSGRTYI